MQSTHNRWEASSILATRTISKQMTINWNQQEKDAAKFIIFEQGVDRDSFSNSSRPNDIHLVDYVLNGMEYCDAVRSYKMVDIFDRYHDKLMAENDGSRIVKITSGHGDTRPNLCNVKKVE